MEWRSEEKKLLDNAPAALASLLGIGLPDLEIRFGDQSGADLVVSAGPLFVMEVKKATSAAIIAAAAERVKGVAGHVGKKAVPLVVVPYMGEVGREACAKAGVGWFDLSGNANIIGPGLRVIVEGKPNRYKTPGRPENLFAPKSSRIVRWFLVHADQSFSQREIARATGLGEGYVSRLAMRMERDGYLLRNKCGAVRVRNPSTLLDSWRAASQFSCHSIHAGHVPARSGEELLRSVANTLLEHGIEYAATGLAAAWALTQFASFRIATLFLPNDPSPKLLEALGYREEARGANLWLVRPNDMGVFQGAALKDGVRSVHPVQVYVDLKGHPERAPEAAERLRSEFLTWKNNG